MYSGSLVECSDVACLFKAARHPYSQALLEAVSWGASVFLALLPWMAMCFLSNRSPLYPLFQGDNNSAFNPQALDEPLLARLSVPVRMIVHPALLPLVICILAAPAWRRGLAARAVSISAILASLALAYSITLAPDTSTVPRYVQPPVPRIS